jgi:hemerythrin-like domain-containing protein
MQRAEALKGLSREHHEALVLARHARTTAEDPNGVDAQAQRTHLLARWELQFAPHFALEEQTLLPALKCAGHSESASLALSQHTELRALVERIRHGDLSALALWGEAMATHVRYEERTLFPLAQTVLEPSELTDVMNPSVSHPSSST